MLDFVYDYIYMYINCSYPVRDLLDVIIFSFEVTCCCGFHVSDICVSPSSPYYIYFETWLAVLVSVGPGWSSCCAWPRPWDSPRHIGQLGGRRRHPAERDGGTVAQGKEPLIVSWRMSSSSFWHPFCQHYLYSCLNIKLRCSLCRKYSIWQIIHIDQLLMKKGPFSPTAYIFR